MNAPTTCVSATNQQVMIAAMAMLEAIANVDFQQCPNNTCSGNIVNFVHIQASNVNNSWVGVKGGRQDINITNWDIQFKIVHELMHCLGFYHEQSRPDRDNFVTIKCANIWDDPGDCSSERANENFGMKVADVYGPYDFDSLMHYDQCSFSEGCGTDSMGNQIQVCATCPQQETIVVKEPYASQWQTAIGQRTHLAIRPGDSNQPETEPASVSG